MTSKFDDLPVPPKENLVSHFILGEIIDHIGILQDEFPQVQIPLLKSHLWDIRNKNVDPEDHLRGFMKAFEKTPVFKDAYSLLDDGMKRQIDTFIAGGDEKVVMAAGAKGNNFHLPSSPPVKHHFSELIKEKLEKLFHHEHATATNGAASVAANGTANGAANGHAKKPVEPETAYPRIFEDKAETKTMEVNTLNSLVKFQTLGRQQWRPILTMFGNRLSGSRDSSFLPSSSFQIPKLTIGSF
jgi:hypothetical protein